MKLGTLLLLAFCLSAPDTGFSEASACAKSDSTQEQCSSRQVESMLSAIYSKKATKIKIDGKNLFIIKDSVKSKQIFVKVLSSKIFYQESYIGIQSSDWNCHASPNTTDTTNCPMI